jgi:dimethylsulfoniopropionate demethylase
VIERIEGGLLSYGNDMTRDNTPHECGLGRFCNTATAIGCIGRDALLRVAKEGPVKQIRAIAIDGQARCRPVIGLADHRGQEAGWHRHLCRLVTRFRHQCGVGIGMVRMTHWDRGHGSCAFNPEGPLPATVHEEFWN